MTDAAKTNTDLIAGSHRYEVIFLQYDDELGSNTILGTSYLNADSKDEAIEKAARNNPLWGWRATEIKAEQVA